MSSTAAGRQDESGRAPIEFKHSSSVGVLTLNDDEDSKQPAVPLPIAGYPLQYPIISDPSCSQRCSRSCDQCSSRCSEGCSQCYSCCSQSCSDCRQRVRGKWREFNDKLRWYSDIIWPGPLGAALNISTVMFKRADIFMWGYNDPEDRAHYWYPDFVRYAAAVRFPLIVIGGGLGTYIVCCGVTKEKLKAFLRALPAGFSLTVIAEQAVFNELFPDSSHIDDAIAYSTIFLAGLGVCISTAYRFSEANRISMKGCCAKTCKERALLAWDIFTRALFYTSFLSIPALSYFDGRLEDQNESFQRAWEVAAVASVLMSSTQSYFLDPATPDSPIVEMAGIGVFLYEMITRLLNTDDPREVVVPEIVIWAALTLLTLITLRQARNLQQARQQQHYRELLAEDGGADALARPRNPYAGQDSNGYFARGRAVASDPSRKQQLVRYGTPMPDEIRGMISSPLAL